MRTDDEKTHGFLQHYGVKGMRWGYRKTDRGGYVRSGRPPKGKPRRTPSRDYEETRKLMEKKPKELSDNELSRINKRLQLETKYKSLTPGTVKKGNDYLKGAVAGAATLATLYNIYNSEFGKTVIRNGSKIAKSIIRLARRG